MNQLRDNNKLMVERIWTIRTIRTTTITTTPAKRLNDMDMNDMVRYGMNHTNDNRITSTPDARHIWYIAYYYYYIETNFLPLVQLVAETSIQTKLVPPYRILMFVCEFNYHICSRRWFNHLNQQCNGITTLLFSWTLNQSTTLWWCHRLLVGNICSVISGAHIMNIWCA